MRVLAASDKFRGTLTAAQACAAIAVAVVAAGGTCDAAPMSDGGEGLLEAFGGATRSAPVVDASGRATEAAWRLDPDGTAVLETARCIGLEQVGGAVGNDAEGASTRGVGLLVAAALRVGTRRFVIGLGGSATTDGGAGLLAVLDDEGLTGTLAAADVTVACDTGTRFVEAAAVFGPQKGADVAAVGRLTARLEALRDAYVSRFGVDPHTVPGSGAAGGLAGAFAVLGARLAPGAGVVADRLGLAERVAAADLVVTGEGLLDATSLTGKVVGAIASGAAGRPVLVVVGDRRPGVDVPGATVVSLVERFGRDRARGDTAAAVTETVANYLAAAAPGRRPPGR